MEIRSFPTFPHTEKLCTTAKKSLMLYGTVEGLMGFEGLRVDGVGVSWKLFGFTKP